MASSTVAGDTERDESALSDLVILLQDTGALTWSLDRHGRVIDLSRWAALTGQPVREARGLGFLAVLHEQDRERVGAAWSTARSHGTPYNIDFRVRCRDGIYRWINARAAPIHDQDGSIRRWYGLLLPIAGLQRFGPNAAAKAPETPAGAGQLDASIIRAARAMLNWSAVELSQRSGVSVSTIRRLEQEGSDAHFRRTSTDRLMDAFQDAGITFTDGTGGVNGLRWGREVR